MISVVITNYNTWDKCYKLLTSIEKYDTKNLIVEIIIIDDASTDPIPSAIQQNSSIRVIRNSENIGYVKSVNKGCQIAEQEFILVVDSDAELLTEVDCLLSEIKADNNIGFLGGRAVDRFFKTTGSWETEPSVMTILLGHQLNYIYYKLFAFLRSKKICIHSFFLFIRRSCIDDIGLMDERFDFLDADIDWSMRVNRSNRWKIKLSEKITVMHEGYGSAQTINKRLLRFYVNRITLFKKYKIYSATWHPKIIQFRIFCEKSIYHALYFFSKKSRYQEKILIRNQIVKIVKSI